MNQYFELLNSNIYDKINIVDLQKLYIINILLLILNFNKH